MKRSQELRTRSKGEPEGLRPSEILSRAPNRPAGREWRGGKPSRAGERSAPGRSDRGGSRGRSRLHCVSSEPVSRFPHSSPSRLPRDVLPLTTFASKATLRQARSRMVLAQFPGARLAGSGTCPPVSSCRRVPRRRRPGVWDLSPSILSQTGSQAPQAGGLGVSPSIPCRRVPRRRRPGVWEPALSGWSGAGEDAKGCPQFSLLW